MRYKAAIFDMDGTILDTVEDMRAALNYAFKETGYLKGREFSSEEVKGFFGSGVAVAVSRAFQRLKLQEDPEEMKRVETVYRPYYDAHCAERTAPYPGIVELLGQLKKEGMRCAAVSNKPDGAVRQLCELHFRGLFDYVQGENTAAGIRRKPAPDMTDSALEAMKLARTEAVYIGDSEVDIETAKAGGMDCISVLWGFRTREWLVGQGGRVFAEDVEQLKELLLCSHG